MTGRDGWETGPSPFHEGELELQKRTGKHKLVDRFGRRAIRPFMSDQHRLFFENLPMIMVGSHDKNGAPWASVLTGLPGFIRTPDAKTLSVRAKPVAGDPLAQNLHKGAPIGLLGIELANRRRNRLNAHVKDLDDKDITLSVDQSYGNCPQYIQTRMPRLVRNPSAPPAEDPRIERLSGLDEAAAAFIKGADTFFVSSYVKPKTDERVEGVDISHRGGRPGFIKIEGDQLTIPDYFGNFMFNTLGNFLLNPVAGLLFIDFEHGDLLTLTGRVEIIWDGPEVDAFMGAERAWRFHLDHGYRLFDALPLRWEFGDYSPQTLATGDWAQADAQLALRPKGST